MKIEHVHFPSSAGTLEGILEQPQGYDGLIAAVICHPHPLYGGTMHNKVVARLAMILQQSGAATLRFNFRGVEGSTGVSSASEEELADVTAALEWLPRGIAPRFILLGGFSFGAWAMLRAGFQHPGVRSLLAVGTPARFSDFGFLRQCSHPIFFIQGENDEFGSPLEIAGLAGYSSPPSLHVVIKGADHFFTGHLPALQEVVGRHCQSLFRQWQAEAAAQP